MLGILLQICSIRREEPTFVSSSRGDAAPMESTASFTIKYPLLKIVKMWIKLRIFLGGRGSASLERTWRVLAHSPKKPKHSMSVTTVSPITKTEWLNFTKSSWGTSLSGAILKISTSCLTRDLPSSNTHTAAWQSSQSKRWPTRPSTATKSSP